MYNTFGILISKKLNIKLNNKNQARRKAGNLHNNKRNKTMTITIKIKNVYGKELVYPVCTKGLTFARMLNRKTFNAYDIANIKELGYTLQVEAQTL